MSDVLTKKERSQLMSRVGSKDTAPELAVRSLLHKMGYRFRLHRKELPGKPDIVLPRHKKVILVHGCFWHQHPGCTKSRRPKTNTEFWNKKLDGNIDRDKVNEEKLRRLGWDVLIVWECETKDNVLLEHEIIDFLTPNHD